MASFNFTSEYTRFTDHLLASLNEIADEFKLEVLTKRQLGAILRHSSGFHFKSDFFITFAGKILKPWSDVLEDIGKQLVERSKTWLLFKLERTEITRSGPTSTMLLFISRSPAIKFIVDKVLNDNQGHQKMKSHVVIVKAKLKSTDSDCKRMDYACNVVENSYRRFAHSSPANKTVFGDFRNWVKINEQFINAISIGQPTNNEDSVLLDLEDEILERISPAFRSNRILIERDSEVTSIGEQLVHIFDSTDNLAKLIIFVDRSGLVKTQKAASFALSLMKATRDQNRCPESVSIISIGASIDQAALEEHSEWLKNYLITQAYSDEEGSGDVSQEQLFRIADNISQAKIFDLHDTCLRFVLLSATLKSDLSLDASRHREALFVQYNAARLNTLITTFDDRKPTSNVELNYDLLASDIEWNVLFKHFLNFDRLAHELVDELSTHKLVNHLGLMARDISCYYSKVRVLIDERTPESDQLIATRMVLLRAVRQLLCDSLLLFGVQPVTRM